MEYTVNTLNHRYCPQIGDTLELNGVTYDIKSYGSTICLVKDGARNKEVGINNSIPSFVDAVKMANKRMFAK